MKIEKGVLALVVCLLLMIDFLTFHDFFEPHTVKDWLLLAVSVLTFAYVVQVTFRKAA